MKKFMVGILSIVFSVVFVSVSFAALAPVATSWGSDDVNEINRMNPNATKTFLGTRLKGLVNTGKTTYASGDNGNPAGSCVTGASTFTTPTTTVFYKTTGAATGESYCLGDGTYNQELTIVLVTDGGKDFVVTPLTKTGLASVTLNDAKDSVTLQWSGSEWYVEANNGATIN